ncbi:Polyketide cyclase/dehydrase [Penicillium sp. IBT 18751x]|nr:Polyketide cyclase/dehydrase [Penicillium sp. IBT 18751x]
MPFKNESSIEIAASPAKVREIFLNFSAYPEWHTDFIKGINIQEKDKTAQMLTDGDKVEVNIENFKFIAEIKSNTEDLFSWQGPPVFTIAGLHKFHFEPIKDGTATIFTQSEELKGLMAWMMSPSLLGKKMKAHFDEFHRDLKARAEAS